MYNYILYIIFISPKATMQTYVYPVKT